MSKMHDFFLCDRGQWRISEKLFFFMVERHQGLAPVLYDGVYMVPKTF